VSAKNSTNTGFFSRLWVSLKGCAKRGNRGAFVHEILIAGAMLINLGAAPGKS
jgi:hypothetical protein